MAILVCLSILSIPLIGIFSVIALAYGGLSGFKVWTTPICTRLHQFCAYENESIYNLVTPTVVCFSIAQEIWTLYGNSTVCLVIMFYNAKMFEKLEGLSCLATGNA